MTLGTELLVIGGGATGLGAAYDAARRGFKVLLVEKGDLANGASGRYHGLLHSGGRYPLSDPQSARDCAQENAVLRRIVPQAIEDCGGLFVTTPADPPDYAERWAAACRATGVRTEEIQPAVALRDEPLLNPRIARAFRVPDAAVRSLPAGGANHLPHPHPRPLHPRPRRTRRGGGTGHGGGRQTHHLPADGAAGG
ncbi:MAG: FAD-dependent oxidoreductase [Chloroflexi bacterium]|nr:FAD-dependent oxidoreductase [Chloroflexota bacterium]